MPNGDSETWLRGREAINNFTLLMALDRRILVNCNALKPTDPPCGGVSCTRYRRDPTKAAKLKRFWLNHQRPAPARPLYERPPIAYEQRTEIRFLVDRPDTVLLDVAVLDDHTHHEFIASLCLNPLEILIAKEETNSRENLDRQQRVAQFNNFLSRKSL